MVERKVRIPITKEQCIGLEEKAKELGINGLKTEWIAGKGIARKNACSIKFFDTDELHIVLVNSTVENINIDKSDIDDITTFGSKISTIDFWGSDINSIIPVNTEISNFTPRDGSKVQYEFVLDSNIDTLGFKNATVNELSYDSKSKINFKTE